MLELFGHFRMAQRELHRSLQVPELAAAVETCAVILVRKHLLVREQRLNRIGELNLTAGTGLDRPQMLENAGFQDLPANHAEIRRRNIRRRLLDDA